jgi:hypothetical protein
MIDPMQERASLDPVIRLVAFLQYGRDGLS